MVIIGNTMPRKIVIELVDDGFGTYFTLETPEDGRSSEAMNWEELLAQFISLTLPHLNIGDARFPHLTQEERTHRELLKLRRQWLRDSERKKGTEVPF